MSEGGGCIALPRGEVEKSRVRTEPRAQRTSPTRIQRNVKTATVHALASRWRGEERSRGVREREPKSNQRRNKNEKTKNEKQQRMKIARLGVRGRRERWGGKPRGRRGRGGVICETHGVRTCSCVVVPYTLKGKRQKFRS